MDLFNFNRISEERTSHNALIKCFPTRFALVNVGFICGFERILRVLCYIQLLFAIGLFSVLIVCKRVRFSKCGFYDSSWGFLIDVFNL